MITMGWGQSIAPRHARTIGRALLAILFFCLTGCDVDPSRPDCADHFAAHDNGAFEVSEAGLAHEPKQNIFWYRCSAGQIFRNRRCVGEPLRLPLDEARAYAEEFAARGDGKGWRLPSIDEMSGIAETSCHNPALNPNVFPGIEPRNYWTTTPSRWGRQFGCSVYTLRGDWYCRAANRLDNAFMLVRDP